MRYTDNVGEGRWGEEAIFARGEVVQSSDNVKGGALSCKRVNNCSHVNMGHQEI